ncbi:aminoglycoside phosphotransferase family protein [Tumebacillus sp. ITR2]|uniref:Aminoglycoside phosphotransferase family protein n=1 Tax=Tumebacillus amylolyticus TaxID=2801339 RepID=A0ABS1JEU1_9BACL|nr:aminoglycoside phosphotransferase family protein [Tumebacillus amylolyticus]MBL0388784.1 aminoglycoside phosphotransferase family protein [Tumebacillus amylolyticus]
MFVFQGREYEAIPLGKQTHNGVYTVDRYLVKTYRTRWKQAHEIFAMEALADVLPVPKIVERGMWTEKKEGTDAGLPYLLITKLPGETVDSLWAFLSREEKVKIVRTAGEWLRKMHDALPMSFIGLLDEHGQSRGGYFSGWGDYLASDVRRWQGMLEKQGIGTEADASRLKAMTELVVSKQSELNGVRETSFLHRDFGLRNLLMTGDGELSGVIDFEHGLAGDPWSDLVRMAAENLFADEELLGVYTTAYLRRPMNASERDRLLTYLAHHAVSQFGYGWREGVEEEVNHARTLMRWVAANTFD